MLFFHYAFKILTNEWLEWEHSTIIRVNGVRNEEDSEGNGEELDEMGREILYVIGSWIRCS